MGLILRVSPGRCNGCGNCEMACAFVHACGAVPGQPRIDVLRSSPAGHGGRAIPIVCLQCDDAACVAACATGALARNETTGAIELDAARCVRCGTCIGACAFGTVLWDARQHAVVKCDLCGGAPSCAQFCPTGALALVAGETPVA